MKKTRLIPTLIAAMFICTSCFTTKTDVGGYREATGTPYKYSKGKQLFLFWGLVPVGRTKVVTPANGNCQVITRLNVIDVFVSGLTAGLVNTWTIKVKVKKDATIVSPNVAPLVNPVSK
ncbi:MAG: hypothetical protein WCO63_01175 [Bacteroidota bacterium]